MNALLELTKRFGGLAGIQVTAFLRWWLGELFALLPQRVRRLLQGTQERVLLEPGTDSVRVLDGGEGAERELARVRWDDAEASQRLKRALVSRGRAPAAVVLRLSPGDVLKRSLMLPLAVEENLRQVLGFEMDRHTPFTAEQVYYDFAVTRRNPEKNVIRVALALVPRRRVDELTARLARWGLRPGAVEVAGRKPDARGPSSIPLAQGNSNVRPAPAGRILRRAAAGTAAALLVAAIAIPLVRKHQRVQELRGAVAEAQTQARAADGVREELNKWTAEADFFAQKKRQSSAVIHLLEDLSTILPDDTWLDRFELRGDSLRIQGESAAASALIPLIEQSPALRDTGFAAPVTRNTRSGLERFVITARIEERGQP